jgi:hypothetical protein
VQKALSAQSEAKNQIDLNVGPNIFDQRGGLAARESTV